MNYNYILLDFFSSKSNKCYFQGLSKTLNDFAFCVYNTTILAIPNSNASTYVSRIGVFLVSLTSRMKLWTPA